MREKIGDYIIDQSFEPRSGSFGSTYRATHPLFKGKVFAVKVINNLDGRKKLDFISEIEALLTLQLQSEHIVVFSYAGQTDAGDLYCAMEYCEGGDLNELCIKEGGLREAYVALIGTHVCQALSEAHGQGIIHRDVKPSNMMLGRLKSGELGVKLIDFGLAKTLDNSMQSAAGVKGTPLFASPEQIRDEDLDDRSDIYSLGVSLWYLLLGQKPPPLNLKNRHEVEAEHVNYDRPFKVETGDQEFAAILERMMAKKRGERFRTAAEVQKALEDYLRRSVGFPDTHLSCSDLVPGDTRSEAVQKEQRAGYQGAKKSVATKRTDRVEDVFEIVRKCPIRSSWCHFMVAKKKSEGTPALVAILETELFENGEEQCSHDIQSLVDTHSNLISSSQGYPNAYLKPKDFYWFSNGDSIVELEYADGVLLQDVVRRHGKFRFSQSLSLLKTLAILLDYSETSKLPLPSMGEGEILLVPSDHEAGGLFLTHAMPDWPDYTIEVNPLSLPDSISLKSEEAGVEQTLDSNDMITSHGGGHFPASVIFCARLYRLIGGKPVPAVAYQSRYGYSNISGLTEESNNLLRENICSPSETGAKCVDILRAICESEGESFPVGEDDQFASVGPARDGASKTGSPFRGTKSQSSKSSEPAVSSGNQSAGGNQSGSGESRQSPPTAGTDPSSSISVSAGPQYQSYNLPEAVSTGPGEFRNPITKKRFSISGPEIRPYRQFVCQETGEIFQLSAQIEPLECLVDVKEPGVVFSPYVAMGEGNRINFLETEGVEFWQEGERGLCPVSGLQYRLPKDLPPLRGIVYEGKPGKVSSPFFPDEADCQAIGPEDWVPGSVLSLRGRDFVLPDESELPAPVPIRKVDEYGGVVRSPFDNSEFVVPDEKWVPGEILICPSTQLLCRLPEKLPERKHVAKIDGDGSEGIVINPFTNRNQKIPGKMWRGDQPIGDPGDDQFLLPSVLPDLKVNEYLLKKPGWVVDPYTGTKTPLLPDEWELGIGVERNGRTFLLLGNLPELRVGKIEPGEFDSVISPYSQEKVDVSADSWKRNEIIRCPETDCLFRLPEDLPLTPETVSEVPQQSGFVGVLASPFEKGHDIEISGEDWIPGGIVRGEGSDQFFRLPEELPPLVARVCRGGEDLTVVSPYCPDKEQKIPVGDWLPGTEIVCAASGRTFLLPESYGELPRLSAIVPSGAGLISVPQTGEELEIEPERWNAGEILTITSEVGDKIELTLPGSIPEIPDAALVSEEEFGKVRSPHSKEVIESLDEADWQEGKVLRCPVSHCLYRLPSKLPEWTSEAVVDSDKTGEDGYVFSPYLPDEDSIKVVGSEWEEGNLVLCEKSKKRFSLPAVPPLRARIVDGKLGVVECPYSTATNRSQKIPPSQWKPGNEIASKKVKGRTFLLPDELPNLVALVVEDRPGFLVSPYDTKKDEFRIEKGDWKPDHLIYCAKTGNELVTPSAEELPKPKPAKLIRDPDREGQYSSGIVESPYKSGKTQSVKVEDWKEGELLRCEATDLLMCLPSREEGLPVWAEPAKLDKRVAGNVVHPDTGDSVAIDGWLWERGNVVSMPGEAEKLIQLPQEIPPLEAIVAGPGKIRSPYEKSQEDHSIAAEDWKSGAEIECPATGRPLKLPADLPPLVALLDSEIAGIVYSPFSPAEPIRVSLNDWVPGGEVSCETGSFKLPRDLPDLPIAKAVNLENAEVLSPYPGSKAFTPDVWKKGAKLTCPETGGFFQLPNDLENPLGKLAKSSREVLDATDGEIIDPFNEKEIIVPGENWEPGFSISSESGNTFDLPPKLPSLRAEVVADQPGFVISPYSKSKPLRLGSIDDWVPGAPVKCPLTQRTMFLPASLPFEQEEVLAAWEKQGKAQKSKLIRLGAIGGGILVILLALFLWPDGSASWKKKSEEISASSGIERIQLAAEALEEFPKKREAVSEIALSGVGNFDAQLDQKLPGMSDNEILGLEQKIDALSFGASKDAALVAKNQLAEARGLFQIAKNGTVGLDETSIETKLNSINESVKNRFPSLSQLAVKQLESSLALLAKDNEGWKKRAEEIEALTGIARISLAASSYESFPDNRKEISEIVMPGFNNFDATLDGSLAGLSEKEIRSLEKQIGTLSSGPSKAMAESAAKQLSEAYSLWQIAKNGAGTLDAPAVKNKRSEITNQVKGRFPKLSAAALAILESRERELAMLTKPVEPATEAFKFAEAINLGNEKVSLAWVEPGSFVMGTEAQELTAIYEALKESTAVQFRVPKAPTDESPHRVSISRGFWLGITEVTIESYLEFLNQSEGETVDWVERDSLSSPVEGKSGQWRMKKYNAATWGDLKQPMVALTWEGAMAFCDYLNRKHENRLPEGYQFTLPTEAEWEYCARAGTTTPLPTGGITFKGLNHSPEVGQQAWYAGNSQVEYTTMIPTADFEEKEVEYDFAGTQVVGRKEANPWGFHDMLGNVSEWCYDFYAAESYEKERTDPIGPAIEAQTGDKVVRGGSYFDPPFKCRVASRYKFSMDKKQHWLGFRIALAPVRDSKTE